jgi:alkylation response protein AidB-like acyl-CoA dehydrogenase
MDFKFGEKEEALRAEIRQFVKENFPPGYMPASQSEETTDESWEFTMHISRKLSEKKWLTLSWPVEYGGAGASLMEVLVFNEEAGYWGIPGTGMGVSGTAWVGPTLMLLGTEEQKKKYLPPIAAAEPDGIWCTGYSEPNAGSDFANLRTRAERKGDHYVINGQKVWNSVGHKARWCWLAARTDTNVQKKHQGISLIIVDMKSPGITVRPIMTYYGFHIFNEVFFDDVKVPVENLVGHENKGWHHLMQALSFERATAVRLSGEARRYLDELVQMCRETGAIKNPAVRRKLADIAAEIETVKILAYETVWKQSAGKNVTYEPSRDKANADIMMQMLCRIGTELVGAYAQLDPLDVNKKTKWNRLMGAIEYRYWINPGTAVAAGTTDTQRNIVGQFGLKLPRAY